MKCQSVSSRIWTRVAVSNSYDDNDYTRDIHHGHLINMIDIYYWDKSNGNHLEHIRLKCFLWSRDIKYMFFFFFFLNCYYISFLDIQSFVEFLVSIINHYINRPLAWWVECSLMARKTGSIPGRVISKTQKMVLDATLLNTQHYKVSIKDKVEQSRERSSTLPYTSV